MGEQVLQWKDIRSARISVPANVVYRSFAAETVVLNVNSGIYYGLDEIGARFFEVLRDAPDLETAVQAIASEYEVEIERVATDMSEFCARLTERGLIELTTEPPRP